MPPSWTLSCNWSVISFITRWMCWSELKYWCSKVWATARSLLSSNDKVSAPDFANKEARFFKLSSKTAMRSCIVWHRKTGGHCSLALALSELLGKFLDNFSSSAFCFDIHVLFVFAHLRHYMSSLLNEIYIG